MSAIDTYLEEILSAVYGKDVRQAIHDGIQQCYDDSVNIDPTPTQNSPYAVSSGGVYDALSEKQDTLTIDSTPTEGSTNPIQSGAVYDLKEDLDSNVLQNLIMPGYAGITFGGNESQTDDLTAYVPLYYYFNTGTSGNAFLSKSGTTYTIPHNYVLVCSKDDYSMSVKSSSSVIDSSDIVLLWKQVTMIKGLWAHYYYEFVNTDLEIDFGYVETTFSGNSAQNDPLSVTAPLIYYRNTGTSGTGFKNVSGGTYSIEHNQALVFDVTDKTVSVISAASLFSRNYVVLLWKQVTAIKGKWAHYYYESLNADYEVIPATNVFCAGNTKTSDPLTIITPYVYYRRYATSGTAYVSVVGGTYSLATNQALVFDIQDKTLSVVATSSVFPRSQKLLLWKQETTIKGPWAVYYYGTKSKRYLKRVMSRQAEGYGFPDNSLEAVKCALADGYPALRVSVALTSDNVWYCTHCYEIEHNSTSNCLSVGDETYTEDVYINNATSTFIDTLLYDGYTIPTLESVLAVVAMYDVDLTLELKDTITSAGAQALLDLLNYYRVKKVTFSGFTSQMQVFTALDSTLDIAIIFNYSASIVATIVSTFGESCNSLRFDCYYTDTIAQSDVTGTIHPDHTLKLGGGSIGRDDLLTYVPWADVCEYGGVYSAL